MTSLNIDNEDINYRLCHDGLKLIAKLVIIIFIYIFDSTYKRYYFLFASWAFSNRKMPLTGLRVIELECFPPGQLCTKFLRDFGASITIVNKFDSELSMLKEMAIHGKKSIVLNLKSDLGVEIFRKLAKTADVLVDPFRKGAMEKCGLRAEELLADNPKLIYARLSGYGHEGYYSTRAGHDINFLSMTGLLSLYGWRNANPAPPLTFSEFAGGSLVCFAGILLALIDRHRTGKGQIIDSNITEGILYVASWLLEARNTLLTAPLGQNWLDGGCHLYAIYNTKDDKFMAVAAIEQRSYEKLLSILKLSSNEVSYFDNIEDGRKILQNKFKEKTQKEWTEIFDSVDACVTPVLSIEDAAQHKHNMDRKSFIKYSNGNLTAARHPKLSAHVEPEGECPSPPSRGQHTVEILLDLGYSHKQIADLCKADVVRVNTKYKL